MDTAMSKELSKPKQRKVGKKRKLTDNPIALDRARRIYQEIRFNGATLEQAHKLAFPYSKAKPASKRWYAKYLCDWFSNNYPGETKEMERMFGLDPYRAGHELNRKLSATTLKNVKILVKPTNGQKFKPFVAEETIEVEDNTTQMRAAEILWNHHFGKADGGTAIGVIILNPDPRVRKPEGSGE
jgi:hypothetical protein